jgi:integrase
MAPATTNVTQRSFRPLLERAGLPVIRFHDLRHTAATLDLYSHVTPTMNREAVGALTTSNVRL